MNLRISLSKHGYDEFAIPAKTKDNSLYGGRSIYLDIMPFPFFDYIIEYCNRSIGGGNLKINSLLIQSRAFLGDFLNKDFSENDVFLITRRMHNN